MSLRGTSAILSVFPVALCHMSAWRDVQAAATALKRRLPHRVRVLGIDGVYPKLRGREQPTLVCVDLGSGQPVALRTIPEKDGRALAQAPRGGLGAEVLVSDDSKELDVATCRLDLALQVCHFHLLRWLWHALEKLCRQLDGAHATPLVEVWAKARPPDGRVCLYALWKGIPVCRMQDRETSALYRLRLLILRLHDN